MRKVFRLIFRLDFKPIYDLIDSHGQILKLMMSEVPENFWTEFKEVAVAHSLKAVRLNEGDYVEFTVEPTSISGVFECSEGILIGDIAENPTFNHLNKITELLCQKYKIATVERFGLRLFCFENHGDNIDNFLTKFKEIFPAPFLGALQEDVGTVTDAAITYEGETTNDLHYRIIFGPFANKDVSGFLPVTSSKFDLDKTYHLTADIDIWEIAFSTQGVSLKRWAREKWRIADKFLDVVKTQMNGTPNGS